MVTHPQVHRRLSARCSVTTTVGSGTSNTCREVVPTITSSGSATWDSVNPGAPGCLPCLRAIVRRAARFAFSGRAVFAPPGSLDGGLDEFDALRHSSFSRSATLPASDATCSFSSATRAGNAAFSTSSSSIRACPSTPPFYPIPRAQ